MPFSEISDYNDELFYFGAEDLRKYDEIMENYAYEEPSNEIQEQANVEFTLQQAIWTMEELAVKTKSLAVSANIAIDKVNDFIEKYLDYCESGE